MTATIACVLRSGGSYGPEFVYALRRGVKRHLKDYEFRVLTDTPDPFGPWAIRLKHDWPGWWSKLEAFRPGIFEGPVLYVDLDTLIVGDLSDIAGYDGPLAMLSDFYRPARAQSGVMAFTPGPETERLYDEFRRGAMHHMAKYRGDGEWLHAHAGPVVRLQDVFPNQIVSYKVHAKKGPPPDARIVAFHGRPRPNEVEAGWGYEEWSRVEYKSAS